MVLTMSYFAKIGNALIGIIHQILIFFSTGFLFLVLVFLSILWNDVFQNTFKFQNIETKIIIIKSLRLHPIAEA